MTDGRHYFEKWERERGNGEMREEVRVNRKQSRVFMYFFSKYV